ncbi:globin domain-containing protein [Defluviimonas sp. WL0024]|uniref:Globin domain-containing protein n=2 Tax=Albidovulum TaxID=205889 RepID=A0ABT3J3I5_9RHOB|nr:MULTISPECIES: globin domain-containing protein [Defluviimonas]MCU9848687.1 globin domain-containing protein [Defluviimonas sp. WL0024]MCW3782248.1 globin domain-containing protein [Defluviimonas salinarum]
MTVTARQSAMIRESFHRLRERLEPASVYFYEALFRRDPSLRAMFRDDLAGQGMKFMTTLGIVIENLESPEALGERFAELGRGHALIGVKAAHFAPMGEALIETLRNELGGEFTPELEEAWRAAYAELSERVIRRGGIE